MNVLIDSNILSQPLMTRNGGDFKTCGVCLLDPWEEARTP